MRPAIPFGFGIAILLLTTGSARSQGFTPEEAVKRMTVAEGFEVKLVASEPLIRQPVSMSFDDRGRLWVLQYLQYPNPAGLKAISVDKYLRTKYDKIPEPPPHGPKGADRITVLSEPDANGRYTKAKDVVTGLNLASGMALGYGGVFVAQPPYLLFYKLKDDAPVGDPEVLLKGFGMDDAHAFANSLQFGPDGWLYGAHGSTAYANINGIEFVQGIWRYHPITKEFELFSEGGGNTWGLDFDRQGNAIAGTNFGGVAMLHQMQGAYHVKNFVKHGELKNPHAYGYFGHVPYTGFKGGHVTCGGIVYQGGAFNSVGQAFQPDSASQAGKPDLQTSQIYIAGNLLSNAVYWHKLEKYKSSFKASFGGDFLVANDTWFRPVDCLTGPDGAVYIADWYDKRATHLDPRDTWDRTNGRIYKVQAKGYKTTGGYDVAKIPVSKVSRKVLLAFLTHKNSWYRGQARQLITERKDPWFIPVLEKMVKLDRKEYAIEFLWALHGCGGLTDALAETFLNHPKEEVRAWTARFLGDAKKVTPGQQQKMVQLAKIDPSALVRSQLACTARRLPGKDGLPIVHELLKRNEDVDDPYIPLLLWWAIEAKAVSDRADVLKLLHEPADWKTPIVQKFILERIGRRYMAEGNDADYQTCAWLLEIAPTPADAKLLISGMEKALHGKRLKSVPPPLQKTLASLTKEFPADVMLVRFSMLLGSDGAFQQALKVIANPKGPESTRIALLEIIGQFDRKEAMPAALAVFAQTNSVNLKSAALTALQPFKDGAITDAVLDSYPKLTGKVRTQARSLLVSREKSALQLLQAIDAKKLAKTELTLDEVRQVNDFNNAQIKKLIEKHWGKIGKATPGEKQNRIGYFTYALGKGKGDAAAGKLLFTKHCANCHTLFGVGEKIGPDLTAADRKNTQFLLLNIVDPSAVQRIEYMNYVVFTKDGRTLTGVVSDANPETITLVNAKNEKTKVPRSSIDDMAASPISLMPEGLLDPLSDQELRDLFAYLQGNAPAGAKIKSSLRPSPLGGEGLGVRGFKPPHPSPPTPLPQGERGEWLGSANSIKPVATPAQPSKKSDGPPLKICLVSGSLEYESDKSLATLKKHLEAKYNIKCSWAKRKTDDDLPGLENLDTCDVAIFFTRRLTIKGEQLEKVKKYVLSGKPIIGLRTASHGFQNWLAMDKLVFGGNYGNHYKEGPLCAVKFIDKDHPILKGVKPFTSKGSLYKNTPLAADTHLLLTGSIPDHTEPIAWTRMFKDARIFYTSLGHQQDFENEQFLRMMTNAVFWVAKQQQPKE